MVNSDLQKVGRSYDTFAFDCNFTVAIEMVEGFSSLTISEIRKYCNAHQKSEFEIQHNIQLSLIKEHVNVLPLSFANPF